MQHDFWTRYIGKSRARLAKAFREFIMPEGYGYHEDPAPGVENKISIEDLAQLFSQTTDEANLTEADLKSLERLRRFLNGEFKNGIDPF